MTTIKQQVLDGLNLKVSVTVNGQHITSREIGVVKGTDIVPDVLPDMIRGMLLQLATQLKDDNVIVQVAHMVKVKNICSSQ